MVLDFEIEVLLPEHVLVAIGEAAAFVVALLNKRLIQVTPEAG